MCFTLSLTLPLKGEGMKRGYALRHPSAEGQGEREGDEKGVRSRLRRLDIFVKMSIVVR